MHGVPEYDRRYTIETRYDTREPGQWWQLREYLREVTVGGRRYQIRIPAGFQWDGASVPQKLQSIIPRWGRYSAAALCHDYLYVTQEVDRKTADLIFLKIMEEDGVPWLQRSLMFNAVRAFGQHTWDT